MFRRKPSGLLVLGSARAVQALRACAMLSFHAIDGATLCQRGRVSSADKATLLYTFAAKTGDTRETETLEPSCLWLVAVRLRVRPISDGTGAGSRHHLR